MKGSSSAGVVQSVSQLRLMASDYMRSHPDDFMPFMDEVASEEQFNKYCDDIQRTAAWGSQLEVGPITLDHKNVDIFLSHHLLDPETTVHRFERSPSSDSLVGWLLGGWDATLGHRRCIALRRSGDDPTTMNGPTVICISIFFFLSLLYVNTHTHKTTSCEPLVKFYGGPSKSCRLKVGQLSSEKNS